MPNRLKKLLQWFLLFLCIGFIVNFFRINREELQILRQIRPEQVILLILLNALYLLLHSYRFKIVFDKCSGQVIAFKAWFKIYILGMFLNSFIPQSGNIYRSVTLKQKHHTSYTQYISTFFSFTWLDTCFNLLLALFVIGIISPTLTIGSFRAFYLVAFLTALIIGLPIFLATLFQSFTIQIRFLTWLHAKLAEVLQVSIQNLRDLHYLTKIILLGLAIFCLSWLNYYLCFVSIGGSVNVTAVIFFYIFKKLSTRIILTPGNFGIQEISFGIISQQMHMTMAEGILFSTLLRIVGYIALFCLALPMGGIDLLLHSRQYRPHTTPK